MGEIVRCGVASAVQRRSRTPVSPSDDAKTVATSRAVDLRLLHGFLSNMESPAHTVAAAPLFVRRKHADARLRHGRFTIRNLACQHMHGLPPNRRGPVPVCRFRLRTVPSDHPENQTAVVAAKPEAIAQHPPNRLLQIFQQHVTSQTRIDASGIDCPGNKTSS